MIGTTWHYRVFIFTILIGVFVTPIWSSVKSPNHVIKIHGVELSLSAKMRKSLIQSMYSMIDAASPNIETDGVLNYRRMGERFIAYHKQKLHEEDRPRFHKVLGYDAEDLKDPFNRFKHDFVRRYEDHRQRRKQRLNYWADERSPLKRKHTVMLSPHLKQDGELEEEFFHACKIGEFPRTGFYCSEAPKKNLADSKRRFWKMIVEKNIAAIVNVLSLNEAFYYPTKDDEPEVYGNFEVTQINSEFIEYTTGWLDDVTDRQVPEDPAKISIHRLSVRRTDGTDEPRLVTLYRIYAWVDNRAPLNPLGPLLVMQRLDLQAPDEILVHCYAGLGRSGTFLVMYKLWRQMMSGQRRIDVLSTVDEVRDHRGQLVYTHYQYLYIHYFFLTVGQLAGLFDEERATVMITALRTFELSFLGDAQQSGYSMHLRDSLRDARLEPNFDAFLAWSRRLSENFQSVLNDRIAKDLAAISNRFQTDSDLQSPVDDRSYDTISRGNSINSLSFPDEDTVMDAADDRYSITPSPRASFYVPDPKDREYGHSIPYAHDSWPNELLNKQMEISTVNTVSEQKRKLSRASSNRPNRVPGLQTDYSMLQEVSVNVMDRNAAGPIRRSQSKAQRAGSSKPYQLPDSFSTNKSSTAPNEYGNWDKENLSQSPSSRPIQAYGSPSEARPYSPDSQFSGKISRLSPTVSAVPPSRRMSGNGTTVRRAPYNNQRRKSSLGGGQKPSRIPSTTRRTVVT